MNKTGEVWKDIKGYEGKYQVSSLGRVKSLGRKIVSGINYSNIRYTKDKILSENIINSGYPTVLLYKNGQETRLLAHRLVLEAFEPNEDDTLVVNHIDRDKLNNDLNNLEWLTQSENIRHLGANKKMGLSKRKPILQYDLNGKLINEYDYLGLVSDDGFDPTNCSRVARGLQSHHKGYKWRYADGS